MIDYDPHRWTDHLFQARGSVVRQVAGRVALFVAWSAVVVAVHLRVRPVGVPSTEDPFVTDDDHLRLEAICAAVERQLLATRADAVPVAPPDALGV